MWNRTGGPPSSQCFGFPLMSSSDTLSCGIVDVRTSTWVPELLSGLLAESSTVRIWVQDQLFQNPGYRQPHCGFLSIKKAVFLPQVLCPTSQFHVPCSRLFWETHSFSQWEVVCFFLVTSTPSTELNTLWSPVVLYSSLACGTLARSKFGSRALLAQLASSMWISPLLETHPLTGERAVCTVECGTWASTQQPESRSHFRC